MRKLKIIGFVVTGSIILFTLYYQFGLFERHNFVTVYWDIWRGNERIIGFGEMSDHDAMRSKLAPTLGFNYELQFGCVVTTPIINGLEDYNNIMGKRISARLGDDWNNVLNIKIKDSQ